MTVFQSIRSVIRHATNTVMADRLLTESVVYRRTASVDYDPAEQLGGVAVDERTIPAVVLTRRSRRAKDGPEAKETGFLIRAADLDEDPRPGDRIVRDGRIFQVREAERAALGSLWRVMAEALQP